MLAQNMIFLPSEDKYRHKVADKKNSDLAIIILLAFRMECRQLPVVGRKGRFAKIT